MRVIDLTHTLENGMSQYPGQPDLQIKQISTVADDGCQVTEIHSVVHVGTHCDAPAHYIPDGATMERLSLEQYVGEAVLVDLPDMQGREIQVEHLERFEIQSGDIVLFRTGAWKHWNTSDYPSVCPFFTAAAARWLASKQVKCVALDFISPDAVETTDFEVHHILLGAGVVIVENLRNLEQIKTKRVLFSAAPLKIRHGDGAFTRAFAIEL